MIETAIGMSSFLSGFACGWILRMCFFPSNEVLQSDIDELEDEVLRYARKAAELRKKLMHQEFHSADS